MAHIDSVVARRTHRTNEYGSFTVLAIKPICTHEMTSFLNDGVENE